MDIGDQGQLDMRPGEDPGTVVLAGELDMASAPALAAALRDARRPLAAPRLVLDLSGVTFMDIAGLRAIEGARVGGRPLAVRGASGQPARLLALLASDA
jgi:anti-anti-sigma factor